MESWSVLGSGSDDDKEEEAKTTLLDFGGIKISSSRVLELMQSVQHKNTVELDSIGEMYQRRKFKKKKKKKKKGGVRIGVGGAKSMEDVSETTSEIRSTTCTSTSAAECRDMRRPKFDPLFDDPELDDNGALSGFKALTSRIKKAPPLPSHKQVKEIARLDKITADEQKRRQRRWQKAQQELTSQISPLSSELSPNILHQNPHQASSNLLGGLQVGSSEMDTAEAGKGMMEVSMEEEDDDQDSSESDSDMKFSLLSQINKIEKLLDFEVS